MAIGGKNVSLGAILAGIGGLLAVVGTFLAWVTISGGGMTEEGKGTDHGAGKFVIILGIIAICLVAAWIMDVKIPNLALITAGVGALILVVLAIAYFTKILESSSIKDTLDMASALSAYGVKAGLGIGFLANALGGILVVVGGLLPMLKKTA
jgi:hypothetical protein